jgi:putative endonuclease
MPANELTVYILTNDPRHTVLYIGVTNDLLRRMREHFHGLTRGFAYRMNCKKLVWCETFRDPLSAIECEKRLKGWARAKKEALILESNPEWRDLGLEMFGELLNDFTPERKERGTRSFAALRMTELGGSPSATSDPSPATGVRIKSPT